MYEGWKDIDAMVADVEVTRPGNNGSDYSVVFTYTVDEKYYAGTYTTSEAYRKGDTIGILYDPTRPERNNLVEQQRRWHWILGIIILVASLVFLFAITH